MGTRSGPRHGLRVAAPRYGQLPAQRDRPPAALPDPPRAPLRSLLPPGVRRALPGSACQADHGAHQQAPARTRASSSPRKGRSPTRRRTSTTSSRPSRPRCSRLWNPGYFERGGNTKTHGIVRAEFTVRDDLPENMRRGIFAEPRSYRAWVRFSGPGPYVTPDIDDVGFMSMSIKLMGVPGPKLLDDEKFTQDLLGVSTPTFVTPDTRANARLQHWSYKNAQVFYFVNFREPHILDSIMQLLWTKTQTSPLEGEYFSCVPYLLGEGQAMQYSFRPRLETRTPRAAPAASPAGQLSPRRHGDDARRAGRRVRHPAPAADRSVPDADREQRASCGRRSSRRACRPPCCRIPRQTFDSPEQLDVRAGAVVQPVALHPGAPPAGQPEPGPEADVQRAVAPAAEDERRSSTTSRPATRCFRALRSCEPRWFRELGSAGPVLLSIATAWPRTGKRLVTETATAVDDEALSSDESRCLRGEEADRVGDVFAGARGGRRARRRCRPF